MAITAAEAFRDYETDGVPSSGSHKIKKSDMRSWGTWVEAFINAIGANSGLVFTLRASLDLVLNHPAATMAWVIGDPVAANNGIYQKLGASGTGSWLRVSDLPFSFIIASDVGAGTPNAIQATTSIPVSESALIILNVFEANTGSATVSFNGGAALTIKTNTGNNVAAGGLVAGMRLLGVISGSTFRLVSDQVSSAIVAAAEAAADRAEAAASLLNYVTGYGSVDLTGAVSAQAIIAAAVAASYANNTPLFWPDGLYRSTANIPNFHDVKHEGPGVIVREGLGRDLVGNGDFSSTTGWTLSGGAAISGGSLSFPGSGTAFATKAIAAIKPLTTYEITYTIVSVSAGNASFRLDGSTDVIGASRSAPGTYTERLTSNATTTGIQIVGSATFNGVYDSLTVREVVTAEWHITPANYDTINHVYAAASGGASTNDGLSPSQPIDTFQHAIDALEKWAPLEKGQWQIDFAPGVYARGRFPDEGMPSSYPIIVAGPPVSIGPGVGLKMSVATQTGSFTTGENLTFSPSGATATGVVSSSAQKYITVSTVTSGTPAVGDTIIGGTSGATATVDYISPAPLAKIKEGATESAVGILGFYTSLRVRDVEVEDYNGSTSSNGIRVDNGKDLFLENVHLTDCYHGVSVFNHSKLDVKGGFAYDCGYLNSTTAGGFAYRGVFHAKFEIGTQNAGTLALGPAIKGCSGTIRAQELSTGHLDFVLQHDNDAGARLLVNSRLNIDGSSFKRNTASAVYCTQGSHVDPTSNTVFGTGADANGRNYSIGFGSTASTGTIVGYNMGNGSNAAVIKTAFPNQTISSTTATTIDSLTIDQDALNDTQFSQIACKKIRVRVFGDLNGTTGTFKRLQVRLGSTVTLISFATAATGPFQAEFEIWFRGTNSQFVTATSSHPSSEPEQNAEVTESTSGDITLALEAVMNNAADSILAHGYEWEQVGF